MSFFHIEYSANRSKKKIYIGGKKVLVLTNKRAYQKYENLYFEKAIARMKEEIRTLQGIVNSCLDISKLPQARGRLREIQLSSYDIFKRIHRICEKNKLKYWLDFGSLLGAVRHKGFVPWDDDVDICMVRDDYMKLLPLLQKEFEDSEFTVREVLSDHLQIRIKNADNTIGVDIFPVDVYNRDFLSEEEAVELNRSIKEANNVFISLVRRDREIVKDIPALREAIDTLTNELILHDDHNIPQKPILFYGIDYPHTHKVLIIPYDDLFPLVKMKFEDGEFYCPHNAASRLECLYGDWMSFPKNFDIWNS